MTELSLLYLPAAVGLGALHALEPGHAKALTAAYLVGIKGTWRDAVALGLAAATTHSLVVIGLSATALWLGREAFAGEAMRWLQVGSGALVALIGGWMLWRRLRPRPHHHHHGHDHAAHDHPGHDEHEDDAAHAAAHAAGMPGYVGSGQRPGLGQVLLFGASGGMLPCPASVSVMLLALSVGETAIGLAVVAAFSVGLALALVGVGLVAVWSMAALAGGGRFDALSRHAPLISAVVVLTTGVAAMLLGLRNATPEI